MEFTPIWGVSHYLDGCFNIIILSHIDSIDSITHITIDMLVFAMLIQIKVLCHLPRFLVSLF